MEQVRGEEGVSGQGLEGPFWEEELPSCIQLQFECLHCKQDMKVHSRNFGLKLQFVARCSGAGTQEDSENILYYIGKGVQIKEGWVTFEWIAGTGSLN